MIPIGTMGHEHVQRYGSDEAAFRAMKERRPQRSSFLLDTFDTLRSGLPAALEIIAEDPTAHDSIRYDSGDKEAQLRASRCARRARSSAFARCTSSRTASTPSSCALRGAPREDGRASRRAVLRLRRVARRRRPRGAGSRAIASRPSTSSRRRASAPVMKFSNDAGKVSVPGDPGRSGAACSGEGPAGIVAQEGERVRAGYVRLDQSPSVHLPTARRRARGALARRRARSPKTRERAAFAVILKELAMLPVPAYYPTEDARRPPRRARRRRHRRGPSRSRTSSNGAPAPPTIASASPRSASTCRSAFCHPEGSLFVPGAVEDTTPRARVPLRPRLDRITTLVLSLDTHRVHQIFHP